MRFSEGLIDHTVKCVDTPVKIARHLTFENFHSHVIFYDENHKSRS